MPPRIGQRTLPVWPASSRRDQHQHAPNSSPGRPGEAGRDAGSRRRDRSRGADRQPTALISDLTAMSDPPRTSAECPICLRGEPLDVLVELGSTWVTASVEALLPGYVCVVSKRHVTEPFELAEEPRRAWWDEVSRVAYAVHQATGAAKLNYEIHGNTLPHLHLHVYPRYAGDPFEGSPIDWRAGPLFRRTIGELGHLRAAILGATGTS